MSEAFFERRGLPPRPRRMPCEFCGAPLADPIEEPFNLAFATHLRAHAPCMELFRYSMDALRDEIRARWGTRRGEG